MRRNHVPNHSQLQAAIDATGFPLVLDTFYQPFESSGFHPCKLGDADSGFEVLWQPIEEIYDAWPTLRDAIQDRDVCLTFIWHGDMAECASVLIVSAALARGFDAVVFNQDHEILSTADQLMDEANAAIEGI
ncbi:MAG TPA: hypothetical protein VMN36_02905 [Verrucomicrobiales bacterium]|nr:hypothetical protein [Verrucomicrobiales bacterium]